MKELLDGSIGIRKNQTCHLVVFLSSLALKGNQCFDELLLLVGPVGHVRWKLGTAIPNKWHDKGNGGHKNGDANDLHESFSFRVVDILHPPDGQVFVGGIEHRPDESTQTPNHDEQRQLPNTKVGIVPREGVEFAKREQLFHVGLSPQRIKVLDGEQRPQSNHGTEEGSPGQFGRPITGAFLQTEQNTANGSPKSGGNAGGGTARHEIPFLAIVAKVAELGKGRIDPPKVGPALRDARRHDGTGVDLFSCRGYG